MFSSICGSRIDEFSKSMIMGLYICIWIHIKSTSILCSTYFLHIYISVVCINHWNMHKYMVYNCNACRIFFLYWYFVVCIKHLNTHNYFVYNCDYFVVIKLRILVIYNLLIIFVLQVCISILRFLTRYEGHYILPCRLCYVATYEYSEVILTRYTLYYIFPYRL